MTPICKACGGKLIKRSQNSRGETLWDCISCDAKWQSRTRYGFTHFYQQGTKLTKRGRKKHVGIRLYDDQHTEAKRRGGIQRLVDEVLVSEDAE